MRAIVAVHILLAFFIAGCASEVATRSYVEGVPQIDPTKLGRVVSDYMKETYPATKTTLVVVAPAMEQINNPFTSSLLQSLSHAGFALADDKTSTDPNFHRFIYYVTSFEGRALVRLVVDGHRATRCYAQGAQGIVPATPLTLSN
jgi:ABC-type Fe3+-hydroxamate transport system substrate-binding protein